MNENDVPSLEEVGEALETGAKRAASWLRFFQSIRDWFAPKIEATPTPTPQSNPQPVEDSRPGILIIGPGGTGKTTLARMLSGQWPSSPLEAAGEYVESLGIEEFEIENPPAKIVVPPGQHRHRPRDWGALHAAVARGEYRGVILVAAYGHHSLGISYKDHRLYPGLERKSAASFLKVYCASQRKDEVGVLKELAPHLRLCQSKLWFLTLVTKQDLWDKDSAEAEKHYRDGEYGKIVKEVGNHLGHQKFREEVVLASLVISNFTTTARNETLRQNAAGYDQLRQVRSLRTLFDALEAFRKWEAE